MSISDKIANLDSRSWLRDSLIHTATATQPLRSISLSPSLSSPPPKKQTQEKNPIEDHHVLPPYSTVTPSFWPPPDDLRPPTEPPQPPPSTCARKRARGAPNRRHGRALQLRPCAVCRRFRRRRSSFDAIDLSSTFTVPVSGDIPVVPAPRTVTIRFNASRRIPCDHSLLVVHSQPSNPSASSTSVRVGDQCSNVPTLFSFVRFCPETLQVNGRLFLFNIFVAAYIVRPYHSREPSI
nr:uncharacterized protein LOC127303443 [Lolium perenne]